MRSRHFGNYSNAMIRAYTFPATNFGGDANVTQLIPVPKLKGRGLAGRVLSAEIMRCTEDFTGDVSDALWQALVVGLLAARLAFVWEFSRAYFEAPLSILDVRDGGWNPAAGLAGALLFVMHRGLRRPALRRPLTWAAGIGTVVERTLPAQMKRQGAAAWGEVADGEEIRLGDAFKTGPGGRLKMIFDDKSILISGTSFGFRLAESQSVRLAYVHSDTLTDVGADTDSVSVGWSFRF